MTCNRVPGVVRGKALSSRLMESAEGDLFGRPAFLRWLRRNAPAGVGPPLITPPAASEHLGGRIAERLENLLALELVVRFHHDYAKADQFRSVLAWHVADIGS
jgi:hypothetical protein